MAEVTRMLPGGAPDDETQDLMARLSDLQMWCFLMAQKDSGGAEAGRLVQDTRAFIVERLYPNAIRALSDSHVDQD
jgi:hypothetical protein